MSSTEPEDLDARIRDLQQKAGEFLRDGLMRSASRVYGELSRLARREQRVVPYLRAVFHQMDLGQNLLEPRSTRERAIELIALLESEEQARTIQPDLPVQAYQSEVNWMTACTYENLAEATGQTDGYNSEGMHQCITDGIQVCRRTGKMGCVNCFREYALQVYTAADDLDLALHHARTIASHRGPWSDRGNRRHYGARNEAALLTQLGQLEAAEEAARRSLEWLAEDEVSLPVQGRRFALAVYDPILLLTGKVDPHAPSFGRDDLPPGESLDLDLRHAWNDALRACCRGDHEAAVAQLTPWDRRLSEAHCLHDWFETRLRLLAAHRLAGREDRLDALAKPLHAKAKQARDYLTLRRLRRVVDPTEPAAPHAPVGPPTVGAWSAAPRVAVPAEPPAAAPTAEPATPRAPETAPTPLDELLSALVARLEAPEADAATQTAVLSEVLALDPAAAAHPRDAARLLHLLPYLLGDGSRAPEIWLWAERLAAGHAQNALVCSLLAVLGDILRQAPGGIMEDKIEIKRIESLFRQSLDLGPDDVGSHARAGAYYLAREEFGEAERCLARGSRLDRANGFLALRLAEVYRRTDRARDGLAVLDMCLREGCDDPGVAWEAAMGAHALNQFESLLTYIERFESQAPGQPWAAYYRALGLLETGRPEDAAAALDEEERRNPEHLYPVDLLRACAAAALGRVDDFRDRLGRVLATPLTSVDYLTLTGLTSLSVRLWKAAACLPPNDPERAELASRLLVTGLAPEELFEEVRQREEVREGVKYYRCLVRQPLDEDWSRWPGCLHGQEAWTEYCIVWGVLACDEDEAKQRVLDWQERCYPLAAAAEQLEQLADNYTDRRGVVWQGARWSEAPTGEQLPV